MTGLRRLAAVPLVPILAVTIGLLALGCVAPAADRGPSATPTTQPSVATSSGTDVMPSPGQASPVAGASIVRPKTTNAEGFGSILDELPPSFPKLPGQEPADTGSGPTSGSFTVRSSAIAAAAAIAAQLTSQGWTADVGTPLEDGSLVLEATGEPSGCKAEIRFTPHSGSVIMSVLYGARCPYP